VVYVAPDQDYWETMGTIIHESVHVFQETMKYVCEETSGDEAEAYNIEQISMNLIKDFHALDDQRKA
jgi:hypothetical protein